MEGGQIMMEVRYLCRGEVETGKEEVKDQREVMGKLR